MGLYIALLFTLITLALLVLQVILRIRRKRKEKENVVIEEVNNFWRILVDVATIGAFVVGLISLYSIKPVIPTILNPFLPSATNVKSSEITITPVKTPSPTSLYPISNKTTSTIISISTKTQLSPITPSLTVQFVKSSSTIVPENLITLKAVLTDACNIRTGPSSNVYYIMFTYQKGEEITLFGSNEQRTWFAFLVPDGRQGWITKECLEYQFDPAQLTVLEDPPTPTPEPIQGGDCPPGKELKHPKGDANGDCKVSDSDYDIWKASYNKKKGEPGYNGRADFNGDGKVDGVDYMIWRENYGKKCFCE